MSTEERRSQVQMQKSYFDVLGLCCSSEVALIEKILKPLEGVDQVTVIVPTKTVIVVHDTLRISQLQIEKALNQARLEATIRTYGTSKIVKKWPSPFILACGALLIVSLFKHFFRPLRWFALAAIVVGLPPIILRSIAAIRRFVLDINILMLIAVGGAVAIKDYSEAGFIVFLFTVAEWLESVASTKATSGMSTLMSMAPQKAVLAETGQVVDVHNVNVDTILAVKAGEVIPIDGVVVEGKSEVDEKTLTGESFPVTKQPGSQVWAGTMNIDGYISVKTTALAENSTVAKMARLVEEAQNSRSKTQRLIDSCAKYYTPVVVILAVGIAVLPIIIGVRNRKKWFELALVVLVSACPCALVLSTPVATFCSLLKAAKMGLLIKGGDVLETLAKAKVVGFDKTGTITRGEFLVMEFRPLQTDIVFEKLMYWVASIESKSSHPMATALVDYARSKSVEAKPEQVNEFSILPGEGIYGDIDRQKIYIGNRRIAARAGCQTVPYINDMEEGVTLGYVFSGSEAIGVFTLSDTCRAGAAEAIRELKGLGIKTAMVTGDSTAAATHAQKQLGNLIEVVHAELLPEDKVKIIEDLKKKEGPTLMVGDGMNDAPALAAADVGISMGISGSAVATETSHITLMSNDIRKIPKSIRLARRTNRKIIVNIIFSIITKLAILALAFAGHPLIWAAVLADVGTCLLVILNSMTLLRTRNPKAKKCCSTSHEPCATETCGAQLNCCQSKEVDCHNQACHDYHEEDDKTHEKCSSICDEHDCNNNSSKHPCNSPEMNQCTTDEELNHAVVIQCENGDQADGSNEKQGIYNSCSNHSHELPHKHAKCDHNSAFHEDHHAHNSCRNHLPEHMNKHDDLDVHNAYRSHSNGHEHKNAACNHSSDGHDHEIHTSNKNHSHGHTHKHAACHQNSAAHEHHDVHNSYRSHSHGHTHKHAACKHSSDEHDHDIHTSHKNNSHGHTHKHAACHHNSAAHEEHGVRTSKMNPSPAMEYKCIRQVPKCCDKRQTGECSRTDAKACRNQDGCPSGVLMANSRCCRSYSKECCGGIVRLPEIIVE